MSPQVPSSINCSVTSGHFPPQTLLATTRPFCSGNQPMISGANSLYLNPSPSTKHSCVMAARVLQSTWGDCHPQWEVGLGRTEKAEPTAAVVAVLVELGVGTALHVWLLLSFLNWFYVEPQVFSPLTLQSSPPPSGEWAAVWHGAPGWGLKHDVAPPWVSKDWKPATTTEHT